jgi:ribose/xylose/arabinose/galactoside ABC-type transport system permease subunit
MSTADLLKNPFSPDGIAMVILDRMIWPILLLFAIVTAVLVPGTFENFSSLQFIFHGSVGLGFLALAECICLISGHFDLSIGSLAGFSAMLTALVISSGSWGITSSPLIGVVLIVAIGAIIGLFNGIMIAKLGINPFLQTLAMLIVLEGAKLTLSTTTVSGLPDGYTTIGNTAGVAIGALFGAFLLVGLMMRYTSFGQAVYGLGSDEEAARAVGISTDLHIIAVYILSGALAGVAGLMVTGYTGVVVPTIATDLLFPAFAAAVLGGVSLHGGRGKITGALGGVALLALIQAALNISGTPPEQIRFVNGLVLLAAIVLYKSRNNLRDRILGSSV